MSSLFINGQWQEGAGAALSKTNPADNSPLWRGRAADAAQVDAAVAAGRAAFKHWRARRWTRAWRWPSASANS